LPCDLEAESEPKAMKSNNNKVLPQDAIHIEDSDNDVQCMGTTTVPPHANLTSTHNIISGHALQPQSLQQQDPHIEEISDHITTQHPPSPVHHDDLRSSLPHPLRTMIPYPDDPIPTNFHTSNVGFQDKRILVSWLVRPLACWLAGIGCVSRVPEGSWRFLEAFRNVAHF
jgi:hypothetical protein